MDSDGNLYGTTVNGGANYVNCDQIGYNFCGTIFKVNPKGKETVLYSFCAIPGCLDGEGPLSGVVFDRNGNLYGTTASGGNLSQDCPSYGGEEGGCGVVFELRPDSTETVLYAFCAEVDCTDGAFPSAGVALKSTRGVITLYGTAEFGGAQGANGAGVVYSLSGDVENVLHSFSCTGQIENCPDGAYPQTGVLIDRSSLVGDAWAGGRYGNGTIYKLRLPDAPAH